MCRKHEIDRDFKFSSNTATNQSIFFLCFILGRVSSVEEIHLYFKCVDVDFETNTTSVFESSTLGFLMNPFVEV